MFAKFLKYFLFLSLLLSILPGYTQSSQEPFGKNRVQYKNFQWKFISTTNYEVYYYGNSLDLAIKTATYAEEDYQRIVDLISFTPAEKIKILLYNSISDKIQSNIGLSDNEIMIGGQTVLVKAKIEIAFKGSQIQLMKDISYGVAYTIINTVMYGGNVKDVVKSSYLMNLPEWFINGAAAYIGEDWSQEMDNFMRDKVNHDKFKNPSSYTGEEAKLIGQSIWNFISKEYGEDNIANILGLTRAFRNERNSIESNLGIDYKEFIQKWEDYYKNMNLPISKDYSLPADSLQTVRFRKNEKVYALALPKTASQLSYTQNFKGKYKLKLLTLPSYKRNNLVRGGYKRTDQVVDYGMPLSTWIDETTLSILYRKRDKLYLKNYDLKNKKSYKRPFIGYHQIYSFAYSKDGTQLVFSADKNGQSDIFVLNTKTNTTQQITNDAADDIDPVFLDNGSILFSSTRQNDTLSNVNPLPKFTDTYCLYLYNPVIKNRVQKLTTKGNSFAPMVMNETEICYLSDATGIVNIYSFSFTTGNPVQRTNTASDILSYTFSPIQKTGYYTTLYKGKNKIIALPTNWNNNVFNSPSTTRRALIQSYQSTENSKANDTINFNFNSNEEIGFENLKFESELKQDSTTKLLPAAPQPYLPVIQAIRYAGPRRYNNPFSTDKVISTLMIDPLRGLGALLEGGMSDLLGNHRIDAGGFIGFDFKSSKLFGEYRYLKRRTDLKLRYDRQSLSPVNDYASHRYVLNSFSFTTSYPLSVNHRISLTPFFTTTMYRENSYDSLIAKRDLTKSYEGLRGEYVYDNTLVTGINMLKGTRFKASAEYYVSNQDNAKNFGLMFLDFRKYIPIHKELTLATRVSYGHYFGNSPKNFILGGMDNWLLSNREFYSNANAATNNPLTIDNGVDNSDILFVRYVTSLRGFKYNSQFGPKYLLFNAELRLPVVQYFYNGTISSNFLRNLLLVGFTDIGAAYSGSSPFNFDNTVNVQYVNGYPFSAKVTNYRNPFLIGFGGGLRTMLLGYYVKTDLGWGLQNNILSKPQVYITFGYDF